MNQEPTPRPLEADMSPEGWLRRLPGLESLWQRTRGERSITVAVLDGAVDLAHPSFAGADVRMVESVVPSHPASVHGTGVASILFGQPASGFAGLAPGCRGLIIPIFAATGQEVAACSQLDLARALGLALHHGAKVVNVSGGQLDAAGEASPILAAALRDCAEQGVLVVAAAGNDGCDCLHVPAAVRSVLAVGAMGEEGVPIPASNWGEAYRDQGILAPGQGIPGAVPGGGAKLHTGTSWATPVVTGVAALLLSLQEQPDAGAVRAALLGTARGCDVEPAEDCRRLLVGRLDAAAAAARLDETATPEIASSETAPDHTTSGIDAGDLMAAEPAAPVVKPAAPAVVAAGCPTCSAGPALVYVLGQLGYDFGTEARRDSLLQHGLGDPHDPEALLTYLSENPTHATALTFTLLQDSTPIYAVAPAGAFAAKTYAVLRELLAAQVSGDAERVSIPGLTRGTARLMNGHTVPSILPDPRALTSWSTRSLVQAVLGAPPSRGKAKKRGYDEKAAEVTSFLERVYYELRNPGLTPRERAMNYAATHAFQLEEVYSQTFRDGVKLDEIDVEPSPICRPESDCRDVKLTFFHPGKRLEQARVVYRFTIDVRDVVPVTVGSVRHWHIYEKTAAAMTAEQADQEIPWNHGGG